MTVFLLLNTIEDILKYAGNQPFFFLYGQKKYNGSKWFWFQELNFVYQHSSNIFMLHRKKNSHTGLELYEGE